MLWLDVSDPDSTGDDKTLLTLRQVSSCFSGCNEL